MDLPVFKQYLVLTKPGIVRGNLIAAVAGFFLASQAQLVASTFFAMVIGLAAVIASACVFNNVMDQGIDAKMKRTKNRPLVTGTITRNQALVFGALLLVFGTLLLVMQTTVLAAMVALFGVFMYVITYGYAKRTTIHSTLIGSVSGAVPPVVGYTAVTGNIDTPAVIMFFILVFWQMPHFYAIAMFRAKEYGAAKLPILTVTKPVTAAQRPMILYLIAYSIASVLLLTTGLVGAIYMVVIVILCAYWIYKALHELPRKKPEKWAGMMFGLSLLALTTQSLAIVLDVLLLAN